MKAEEEDGEEEAVEEDEDKMKNFGLGVRSPPIRCDPKEKVGRLGNVNKRFSPSAHVNVPGFFDHFLVELSRVHERSGLR